MKINKIIFLGLSVALFAACGESATQSNDTKTAVSLEVKTDTLVQQASAVDPTNSYWYYAPKSAMENGSLMIFFDSHGNGKLPVSKYLEEAKARNCIFIGSNSIQNGLTANEQQYLIGIMLDDIRQRFLKTKRAMYLCGFSGGARTAARLAGQNAIFSGVIANAAPINPKEQVQNTAMKYVAVVGARDFNLLEVMLTENELRNAPFAHYVVTHAGKHEWMSVSYFRFAFDILESANDKTIAVRCASTIDTLLQSARKTNDVEQQASLLSIASSLFTDPSVKGKYKTGLDSLFTKQTTKTAMETQSAIYTAEMKQQDEYVQLFAQKDFGWWQQEFKRLRTKAKAQTAEGASAQRLLAFIDMIAYVYVDKSMKQMQLADADRFWQLYHLSDSTNPDVYLMRAKYYVFTAQSDKVIPQLELAQKHGYADSHVLETDDAFASYRSKPEFQAILKAILQK